MTPVDVIVGGLAVLALVVGIIALRTSRRTSAVSDTASAGSTTLHVRVIEGEARRIVADDTRDYALLLSFNNRSDAPINVSSCRLRVTYRTRANFLGAVDLEPRATITSAEGGHSLLTLPTSVPPRAQAERWIHFTTANVIPRHCRVQDYDLVVSIDGGRRLVVDASLPSLLAADSDGQGPATWGWD